VTLLYSEDFDRVEDAFRREKQVQNWSRAKRMALVEGRWEDLPRLSSSS
jgi:putative endonuclease